MSAMTAREFNRDVSAAKRAALEEPLVITDRGNPAFVLVSIDEYRKLRGGGESLADALAMTDEEYSDVEYEPVRMALGVREVEF